MAVAERWRWIYKGKFRLVRWFLEVLGLGVALTSMGWILGHLIAFAVLGRVLVGEDNRSVVFAEIGLVSIGICCLAASYVGRISGRVSE